MNQEIKPKWVTALRSGSYKQATGTLRCNAGFCCLGVLVDVAGTGRWEGEQYCVVRESEDGPYEDYLEGELGWYAKHFGLTTEQEMTLVRMNDGAKEHMKEGVVVAAVRKHSFAEIADWIVANL